MYFAERTVSPEFRAALCGPSPGLEPKRRYWRMTACLMFSTWRDEESRELLLPAELVAAIEDQHYGSNYCAADFLRRYRADVVDFTIRPHEFGACRRIISVAWPSDVPGPLDEERRREAGERVLMSSGVKWRREHSIKERKQAQAEAIETHAERRMRGRHRLLNYLKSCRAANQIRSPNVTFVRMAERICGREMIK